MELAEQTGVLMASRLGGTGTLIEQIAPRRSGPGAAQPFFIPMAIANMPAGVAGIAFGALGPNFSTTSACASSGHAIGEAYEIIRRADAEVMVAGGCEAPVYGGAVGGFAAMRALSTRNDDPAGASRPFDAGRDGFVVAEGAAALILEELASLNPRRARRGLRLWRHGRWSPHHHAIARRRRRRAGGATRAAEGGPGSREHRPGQRPRHQHRGG
jgi:3-oxoacyl-[acyl-carrier-protein] synthase II